MRISRLHSFEVIDRQRVIRVVAFMGHSSTYLAQASRSFAKLWRFNFSISISVEASSSVQAPRQVGRGVTWRSSNASCREDSL
jgi:hypothetical protein